MSLERASTMTAINGLEIHREVQGEGPPIVFVHGLGATSNVWYAQRTLLSKNYRVIVYDRSGSGRSEKANECYSIDAWTDELLGLLDDLAIPSAVVVGHSLGSMIAMRFAGEHADRTKALILAGGEANLGPGQKHALTERALAGLVREMFLANDAKSYALHCLALRDGDVRADLANIKCPTLLLLGDQDMVTPITWQRIIAAGISDSRIRIVPNTAHMTMLESPAVFNTVLLEFLAALEL
jgi:3-oxoadipate enol-lactonase